MTSKRKDFGKAITQSSFFAPENYQAKNLTSNDLGSVVVNKKYQTHIPWIQETYPPIYNFRNQKLGQFTPSLELEGYEYKGQFDNSNLGYYNQNGQDGDNIKQQAKSLFIDSKEYDISVKKRFKDNYPKEYIRPLISFKHYEKFIENNSIQTVSDNNNRKKLYGVNGQSIIAQNVNKSKSYNIQHIYDLRLREQKKIQEEQQKQFNKNKQVQITIKQNEIQNMNTLNNDNKLTLKDANLNYIANNIDKLQQKISKSVKQN